ncbi:thioredoxin family protein [Caldibacillus thermolactis]|jgi:Thioredoxin|uniref:Thioredoxin family protein n=1 Tax=Pallidibacillus thermolactis TaxID=251051 RepID=A0ABT2WHW2_9BACI|nr:thioredoxin family protein [Pallidibacillus thermolactis]MCU9594254.1 thioredoxin family protein [Pallidibacillus thermolactis]MCU9601695.1 thioredoxin family protein [Pallidibacillus thermolactis subsp. kokeshiiformis]MED1672107.1 thioredoxin family protein [Pallidibacillus thermolactis subsp. kokeshiiformis]
MHLHGWFEKAMSYNEYVDQMTRNKEKMLSIYERFHLKDDHVKKLGELQEKNLRVIALTEDWCGDAMVNNPILMKIAETANIEVRFLLRDQNLELMDQYLTNGKSRSIPIYIFIDKDGKEVAVWGPRAPEVQAFVERERAALPDKDAPEFADKQKEMYRKMSMRFLEDEELWEKIAASIVERICDN